MDIKSSNWCWMPWHALAITASGNVKPCCQYRNAVEKIEPGVDIASAYNNAEMRRLRGQMLNGEKPIACNSCWQREDQIGTSRRIWFNQKFSKHIEDSYQYTEMVDNPKWIQIDLNLSNVCNLKCRMCGSWASNQWFDEELRLSSLDEKFRRNPNTIPLIQHDIDALKSLLPHLGSVRRIDFKGGEPMLAKNHNQFLDHLIDHGYHKQITLQYTTNGTVINPGILERLRMFESVRLMFSIEGTGTLYQYIRGGKHTLEEVTENIMRYSFMPNAVIGFNVTIQAYNLLDLQRLHTYLNGLVIPRGNAKDAFNTICNDPDYLSPFVVPDSIIEKAIERLQGISDFEHLVNKLAKRTWDPDKWDTFIRFTNLLDEWRSENVISHIEEFREWFE